MAQNQSGETASKLTSQGVLIVDEEPVRGKEAVLVEDTVVAALIDMGFQEDHIRRALGSIKGTEVTLEVALQRLLESHDDGIESLSHRKVPASPPIVIEEGTQESVEEEHPAKRARLDIPDVQMTGESVAQSAINDPRGKEGKGERDNSQEANGVTRGGGAASLARKLSFKSQECFRRVVSAHDGISQAAVARLLLRCAAALRQGALEEEQVKLLRGHLEAGQVDLVHHILLGMGVKNEPAMPLEDGDRQWECPICFTEQDEIGWRCTAGHRYCSNCMQQHVASSPSPKCPTIGCSNAVTEADLKLLGVSQDVLEAFRNRKLQGAINMLGASDITGASGNPDSKMDFAVGGSSSSTSTANAQEGKAQENAGATGSTEVVIRCPNIKCGNVVLVPRDGPRQRYSCTCGTAPFCTSCRQSPYHYHGKCTDVQGLRERWLEWVSGGRDEYHGAAAKSAVFDGQVQALRESLERQRELEKDEAWKEKHCRSCPHCGRPVQKLEGCSSMVCGSDAHGGNDQPGCGQGFDWGSAPRYTGSAASRELPKVTAEEARCRGRDLLHVFVDCSLCDSGGQGIKGPRFRCLHCDSFDVCQNCEPHLGKLHPVDHVFEILFEPDFDWGGVGWLPSGTKVRIRRRGTALPRVVEEQTSSTGSAASASGSAPPRLWQGQLEGQCGTILKETRQEFADRTVKKLPIETYQYGGDRGRWHNYMAGANEVIKRAARDGSMKARFVTEGRQYIVDLTTMRQRNVSTGGSRPVRGIPRKLSAAEEAEEAEQQRRRQQSCRVELETGNHIVVIETKFLEPILKCRKEAEDLVTRAMAKKDRGGSPSPERADEDAEQEDGEDDYDEYSD